MNEASIILKNHVLVTVDEFRILNEFAKYGNLWYLIQKSSINNLIIKQKIREYIFDEESLTIFRIISQNILISWNTSITKNLKSSDEFQLTDSLYLIPCIEMH
jgi:hypothetical protein